ncbi:hypothetical protein [Infirmifilum sp.]|jgi:hypothetical protein|uniref:hypothetical protein n=1 Tax=Infirmifilum sp. TaxID=2856575 RepID=UPI003D141497
MVALAYCGEFLKQALPRLVVEYFGEIVKKMLGLANALKRLTYEKRICGMTGLLTAGSCSRTLRGNVNHNYRANYSTNPSRSPANHQLCITTNCYLIANFCDLIASHIICEPCSDRIQELLMLPALVSYKALKV